MIELLASDYRPWVQDALAYSICFAALVWGAGPERAVALVWLVCFEFSLSLYRLALGTGYQVETTDLVLASIDTLAGLLWVVIALNANRNYPLFIAALQLLVMAAHLVRGLIESIAPIAYAIMIVAPGWLQLFILAAGLTRHIQRKRGYGPYREWRVPVRWFGLLPAQREKGWCHDRR